MRKPYRVALSLAAVLALTGVASPAVAASPVVLDQGHVDVFGIAYENGVLNLHVHDDAAAAEYDPSEVELVAKPAAKTAVPDDPAYSFLGDPADPVWVLPQVQDPELLFPGIAAEEVEPGVFKNDTLKIDVVGVRGPADFSIFTVDGVGAPTVLVDSGDGLPDRTTVTAGGHKHANWAFEASGTYTVWVRARGTLANGKTVFSPLETYTFKVQS
ncbi:choice-of-anchor M domain-containing protein [Kribbella swartbergensis]